MTRHRPGGNGAWTVPSIATTIAARSCRLVPWELDLADRVGGGDGPFDRPLTGRTLNDAVRLRWAHSALLAT